MEKHTWILDKFSVFDMVLLYFMLSFILFVLFLNIKDNAINSNTALIMTSLAYTFVAMGITLAEFYVRW